ncbi:MAG: hypothetical protein JKY55_15415 [Aliivibrio sp.]|uniref:DUF6988 family protein n=1 Tax=Aliivibrio sp. TaxID=1872443 RepID=UPI001A3E4C91|nr:hypothetical protein [Aliivibrio sp.]
MDRTKEILLKLESSLNGIELPNTGSIMVASSYYSLCVEHFRSIVTLTELELYGSASSLLRSLFESYTKGLWFEYCSSEVDIELLNQDKFNKPFGLIVKEIDEYRNSFDNKISKLSVAKKLNWGNLNNLTHAGPAQITRRISGGSITPNYNEEFIKDMLSFSTNYGLLAAGQLALLSGNKTARNTVLEVSRSLFKNGDNKAGKRN